MSGVPRALNSEGAPAAQLSVRDPRRPSRGTTVGQYSVPFEVVLRAGTLKR